MSFRDSILRLPAEPLRPEPAARRMRCASCGKPIEVGSRFIRMYGEAFHDDCAFFSLRRRTAPVRAAPEP